MSSGRREMVGEREIERGSERMGLKNQIRLEPVLVTTSPSSCSSSSSSYSHSSSFSFSLFVFLFGCSYSSTSSSCLLHFLPPSLLPLFLLLLVQFSPPTPPPLLLLLPLNPLPPPFPSLFPFVISTAVCQTVFSPSHRTLHFHEGD